MLLNTSPCAKEKKNKTQNLNFEQFLKNNGILLPKLFCPTVSENCSSDRAKLLKFEAEGREFAKHFKIT
jgi:hypothetical protein